MLAAFKQDVQLHENDQMNDGADDALNLQMTDTASTNEDLERDNEDYAADHEDTSFVDEDQSEDYVECEMQHEIAFATYKRVSCLCIHCSLLSILMINHHI